MARFVKVYNPQINRVSSTDKLQIMFRLTFTPGQPDNPSGDGKIYFRFSDTEDFAFSTDVNPDNYFYNPTDVFTWDTSGWPMNPGGVTFSTVVGKDIVVNLNAIGVETMKWVKVLYKDSGRGAIEYESVPILFSSFTKMFFTTSLINKGKTRPKKVKVTERLSIIASQAPDIKVEVTNNGFDVAPVWEDMTQDYLARRFHIFTNKTKTDANNWGVMVRYTIQKKATADQIELSEYQIATM